MTEPQDRNRGGEANDLNFYLKYNEEGKNRARIYCAVPIEHRENLSTMMENNDKATLKKQMLRFGAVKGYIDGSIGSHSAFFEEPYKDTPEYQGYCVHSNEHLHEMVREADQNDLQIFIHAIGD